MPQEQTEIRTGDRAQVVTTRQAEGAVLLYVADETGHTAEVHLTPEHKADLVTALTGDDPVGVLSAEVEVVLGNTFLELTERPGGRLMVNADHIARIRPLDDGGAVITMAGIRGAVSVAQSFETLRAMLRQLPQDQVTSPADDPDLEQGGVLDIPGDCGDPECPGVTHGHMTAHGGVGAYVAHHHCSPHIDHHNDGEAGADSP